MGDVWDFFACSDYLDHEVLRPLSHIRANWEVSWDPVTSRCIPEEDSYAQLLNEVIDELGACVPPLKYHDNEDRLGEHVQRTLNWGIVKKGKRWVGRDGDVLCPGEYVTMLEQGGYKDFDLNDLLLAAAGRIRAAIDRGQSHFDDMEQGHRYLLAGVLACIVYHRDGWAALRPSVEAPEPTPVTP